jgi:hypothetical protein
MAATRRGNNRAWYPRPGPWDILSTVGRGRAYIKLHTGSVYIFQRISPKIATRSVFKFSGRGNSQAGHVRNGPTYECVRNMWRLIRCSFRLFSPSNLPEPTTGRLVRSELSRSPLFTHSLLRHAILLHPASQFRPHRPLLPVTSTAAVPSSYHHVGSARAPNDFPTEGGGEEEAGISYRWFMGLCSRFATPLSLEMRIGPLTTAGGCGNVRWHPVLLLEHTVKQRVYFAIPQSM